MKNRDVTIDVMRCVCNYMIVVLHGWAAYQYCTWYTIEFRAWEGICTLMSIALPTLFFISGWLLMRNYSMETFGTKMMRRVKRLAVPYLAWNCLFVLLFILMASVFPRIQDRVTSFGLDTMSGAFSKVLDFTIAPIDGPLWFLRSLFFYSLGSPIVFWACKFRLEKFLILGLFAWMGVSCVCGYETELVHTYPSYSMIAFSVGCVLGYRQINFFQLRVCRHPALIGLGLVGLGGLIGYTAIGCESVRWLVRNLSSLLSFFLLVGLIIRLPVKFSETRAYHYLQEASFFVYASHFLFCSIPLHLIAPRIGYAGAGKLTFLILGVFIVMGLPLCFVAYSVGRKVLQRAFSVFDGTL